MVNAIVMASGFSTRMGKNKLLMKYRGKTIIENVFDAISKCDFNEVVVVSQYEEILRIAKQYNFKDVLNENADIGQSESIKLGIRNSKICEGYMFFVGDQPFLDEFDIKKLISKFKDDKSKIIIPACENRKGNPVIFPSSLENNLMMLKKDEKGKKVISEYDKIEYVKVKEKTLLDIDTQEDYDCLINLYQ